MEKYVIRVSNHAVDRVRERSGINKKSAQKLAERAYARGIKQSDVKGTLNKYIKNISDKENYRGLDIRIYGDKAFVFSNSGKYVDKLIDFNGNKIITLVTILQIPNNLINNVQGAMNKKKKGDKLYE